MSITSLNNSFDIKHLQTICNNASPNILGNYFHKQGWLINIDFALLRQQSKNKYFKTIISLIKDLKVAEQEQLLFDFKIASFFINNVKLGKNYLSLSNRLDKGSFEFLLDSVAEINEKNPALFTKLGLFDQAMYILINFRKEFYEAYSILAHFEFNKIRDTKSLLDLKAMLRDLIISQKLVINIKTDSSIESLYVNKLTLINLEADNTEIFLNAKHIWQNRTKDEIDVFCKLLERYNIKNPDAYLVKEIEIIAIVNMPGTSKKFRKSIIINRKGQTSLGFETLGEQIKQCFERYYITKPVKRLDSFFFTAWKNSSNSVFKNWI